MHDGRPIGRAFIDGPLERAFFVQPIKADTRKAWGETGHFIHDLRWMGIVPVKTKRLCQLLRDFPVLKPVEWAHHLAHRLNAALGICEGAVLFQEGRSGQEDMRVIGGFIEE